MKSNKITLFKLGDHTKLPQITHLLTLSTLSLLSRLLMYLLSVGSTENCVFVIIRNSNNYSSHVIHININDKISCQIDIFKKMIEYYDNKLQKKLPIPSSTTKNVRPHNPPSRDVTPPSHHVTYLAVGDAGDEGSSETVEVEVSRVLLDLQ